MLSAFAIVAQTFQRRQQNNRLSAENVTKGEMYKKKQNKEYNIWTNERTDWFGARVRRYFFFVQLLLLLLLLLFTVSLSSFCFSLNLFHFVRLVICPDPSTHAPKTFVGFLFTENLIKITSANIKKSTSAETIDIGMKWTSQTNGLSFVAKLFFPSLLFFSFAIFRLPLTHFVLV